ncbi:MAG: sulfocyanin-like copper-binding protein [Thermaerobacter sp.]|nr:sulfocyanin-like copper-binding protein [Thermaerobacter sp.]
MKRSTGTLMAASLMFMGLLTACGRTPSQAAANPPSNPQDWVVQNVGHKQVTFKVFAGESNRMTFNGEGNGQLVLTVPTGWHVSMSFVNVDNAQVHSAMIVPLQWHSQINIPETAIAFPHASTPNPMVGSSYGIQQTFHFTAGKPGTYALVCGISGHAAMGMWDAFVVSSTATRASAKIRAHE